MSTTMTVHEAAAPAADSRAGKYLTFHLSNEEFGIRVLKVREIMGLQEITAVPQTPVHIKGVINLRGKVVPVVDLRLKFGLEADEYTQRTCIIVTQVQGENGAVLMGIVVDGVSDVITAPGPGMLSLVRVFNGRDLSLMREFLDAHRLDRVRELLPREHLTVGQLIDGCADLEV